jgi:hypothetical protein
MKSGSKLSGPEFWYDVVGLIGRDSDLTDEVVGRKNDNRLDKVLDYATGVFSKKESKQSDLIELERCISDEFVVKEYALEILEELGSYSVAYRDGTTYFSHTRP